MIEVFHWNGPTLEEARAALRAGKAVQSYEMDFKTARARLNELFADIPHEVWYTERNGDPISMVLPAGTPPDEFPDAALDYMAFEWIPPGGYFLDQLGSGHYNQAPPGYQYVGVVPITRRRQKA